MITDSGQLKQLKALIFLRLILMVLISLLPSDQMTLEMKCDFKFIMITFSKLRLETAVKELTENESACINDLIITLSQERYHKI